MRARCSASSARAAWSWASACATIEDAAVARACSAFAYTWSLAVAVAPAARDAAFAARCWAPAASAAVRRWSRSACWVRASAARKGSTATRSAPALVFAASRASTSARVARASAVAARKTEASACFRRIVAASSCVRRPCAPARDAAIARAAWLTRAGTGATRGFDVRTEGASSATACTVTIAAGTVKDGHSAHTGSTCRLTDKSTQAGRRCTTGPMYSPNTPSTEASDTERERHRQLGHFVTGTTRERLQPDGRLAQGRALRQTDDDVGLARFSRPALWTSHRQSSGRQRGGARVARLGGTALRSRRTPHRRGPSGAGGGSHRRENSDGGARRDRARGRQSSSDRPAIVLRRKLLLR